MAEEKKPLWNADTREGKLLYLCINTLRSGYTGYKDVPVETIIAELDKTLELVGEE